ncbi:MAG: flap endonuclease-1 [Candidatus Altiarchaeota archaeon]|nr:flap endonuclease-1 [Candidatus Altiarchaeota archaeon]
MGVKLKAILNARELQDLKLLSGKTIAIDAFNALYQFLSIIRQMDGTSLMNGKGEITSHLSGIFYRTAKLLEAGIQPCYVFDGPPPAFKLVTATRKAKKQEAMKRLEEAKKKGDWAAVRTYAQQTARLEPYMLESAKELLDLMGIPWVDAPGEGEAQAAYMAKQGTCWAAASQDFDSLLFGAPRLLRNVNVTGRRKVPRKNEYIIVRPELIDLNKNLTELKFTHKDLVVLGLLVGTDYNPGGIKGIGPKKALALVTKEGADTVFESIVWEDEWADKHTVLDYFLKPPTRDVILEWKPPEVDKLREFLVERHGFSIERMAKTFDKLENLIGAGRQGNLDQWF